MKKVVLFVFVSWQLLMMTIAYPPDVLAWNNGGYSDDPSNPDYGTHDWIAEHALDWLPEREKRYIVANLAAYLCGTELPDNGIAPDGIGDTAKHHVYYWSNESLQDDDSAVRASEEYNNTLNFLKLGHLANTSKTAGIMSHYVVDVAVFGHVMGAGTDWGTEEHHSDYETYVNQRTSSYDADFNVYISFDGELDLVSAYDVAKELAYDTTFDVDGDLTCVWMDQNYNWSEAVFKNRCGESLNLAVNYLTDVLHTLYSEAVSVHNIDTGLDYLTIQEAINASETLDGHTILVDAGTYYEHLIVNKSLTLLGKDKSNTLIDGSKQEPEKAAVYIEADNVSFCGFTVQNGSAGIFLYHCQYCLINGSRILGNERKGIELLDSSNNRIESNVISNNFWGIHLMFDLPICGFTNNTILNNLMTDNEYGIIFFSHSTCNEIIENTIVSSDETGIHLTGSNNIVHNNSVLNNKIGVTLSSGSSDNTISRNVILNSSFIGISMSYANSNLLLDNILNKGDIGLWARNIDDCIFSGNTISMNNQGIQILFSGNSTFYHNNLINNTLQVNNYDSTSVCDNGFEGNYWGNYIGVDLDPQNGIGDTPHIIDENNQDNYPLMGIFFDFSATSEHHVQTICNSSIFDFQYNGAAIGFIISGESGTTGFCRICIPTVLMNVTYKVFVNGTEVPHTLLPYSNSTHSYLYFTYNHSTQEVIIIPEFPSFLSLSLLMAATLLAVMIIRRKHRANLRVPV